MGLLSDYEKKEKITSVSSRDEGVSCSLLLIIISYQSLTAEREIPKYNKHIHFDSADRLHASQLKVM